MASEWQSLVFKTSDPAVRHFVKDTLRIAKEVNAPQELVASIEKGLDLCLKRMEFADASSTQMTPTCKKIETETYSHDWPQVYKDGKTTWNCSPGMISSGISSQFLKSIVSTSRAKTVLEIGMFTGYSALSMAEALPADGKVTAIDIDEYFKTLVYSLIEDSPHKHKVDIVIGKAIDEMTKMSEEGRTFDIVFLDAAKFEYGEYLRLCIEGKLLAPNGTIIVDNAFQGASGYTNPESASAVFADLLKNDPTLHKVLVPIKDGMFLVRRKTEVDERD